MLCWKYLRTEEEGEGRQSGVQSATKEGPTQYDPRRDDEESSQSDDANEAESHPEVGASLDTAEDGDA